MKRINIFLHFIDRNSIRILFVVIFIILVSGIIYSVYLGGKLRYPDEKEYYRLAQNLSSEFKYTYNGIKPTAFRPPGYPIVLSFFITLGANIFYLRLLNFLFFSICIFLLFKISEKLYSTRAAIISICLATAYPVLFYTASTLYPQTLGSLLFLFTLFLLLARKHKSTIPYFVMGWCYGILILTIPIFLILVPIIIIWSIWKIKVPVKYILIFCTTLTLLVGLWSLRNYIALHSFVPISTNSGLNLLLGNSENTSPNSGVNVDISKFEHKAVGMNEVEKNAYYTSEAINFMKANPIGTIKLYIRKFLNYFNYQNQLATTSENSKYRKLLMEITYNMLLLLLCVRIVMLTRYKFLTFEVLLLLLYIGSGLAYALFFTRVRFRLPFDFLLIIVIAGFLDRFIYYLAKYH